MDFVFKSYKSWNFKTPFENKVRAVDLPGASTSIQSRPSKLCNNQVDIIQILTGFLGQH